MHLSIKTLVYLHIFVCVDMALWDFSATADNLIVQIGKLRDSQAQK